MSKKPKPKPKRETPNVPKPQPPKPGDATKDGGNIPNGPRRPKTKKR